DPDVVVRVAVQVGDDRIADGTAMTEVPAPELVAPAVVRADRAAPVANRDVGETVAVEVAERDRRNRGRTEYHRPAGIGRTVVGAEREDLGRVGAMVEGAGSSDDVDVPVAVDVTDRG